MLASIDLSYLYGQGLDVICCNWDDLLRIAHKYDVGSISHGVFSNSAILRMHTYYVQVPFCIKGRIAIYCDMLYPFKHNWAR